MILSSWQFWALMSATFAALTAILAKVGVEGINPDVATFYRTLVVIVALGIVLTVTGQFRIPTTFSGMTALFLTLSGIATGASWFCYFRALKLGNAAQVAPVDKLSVVLGSVFATVFVGEDISGLGWVGVVVMEVGTVIVAVG